MIGKTISPIRGGYRRAKRQLATWKSKHQTNKALVDALEDYLTDTERFALSAPSLRQLSALLDRNLLLTSVAPPKIERFYTKKIAGSGSIISFHVITEGRGVPDPDRMIITAKHRNKSLTERIGPVILSDWISENPSDEALRLIAIAGVPKNILPPKERELKLVDGYEAPNVVRLSLTGFREQPLLAHKAN